MSIKEWELMMIVEFYIGVEGYVVVGGGVCCIVMWVFLELMRILNIVIFMVICDRFYFFNLILV